MKLEVIKSYTLAILVGISLILSYSLWSYQPNNEFLEEDDFLNEEEINLGGTEETKKSLVQPSQIIFDKYKDNYFGFSNPLEMYNLYEDMQTWVLYNLRVVDANGRPNSDLQLEVIYPLELPMELIPSLFTVNDDVKNMTLPNMKFERMFITINKTNKTLTFIFLSTDGKTQIKADVNNTQKYDLLYDYIINLEGLEEYIVFKDKAFPIYLPINPEMSKYIFTASKLEPTILKNALFFNPSDVEISNSEDNEIWYQDGPRIMQVFENHLNMEYILPQEILEPMTLNELLESSIDKINGYKGWTSDYNLESIDTSRNNFISYRMYHKGYPIYNFEGLSTIEQRWADELMEHRQPLFTIGTTSPEEYKLDPTKTVMGFLENHAFYELEDIQNVQLGYRLGYHGINSQYISLSLTPGWFIKVNNRWIQVIIDDESDKKGVS